MKIYIFADLEGISGISGAAYVNGAFAATGSALMAEEINACVNACFDAGATEVVVRDGHGSGVNFPSTAIDHRVRLVQGATPGKRFLGIEGADGMILLGYHAMAGTDGAVLEHTYSSATIANLFLNGEKVGEVGLDAAIAGEYDVPVIMVSGDDKTCAEASEWIPDAITCCVKWGCGCNSALMLSPEEGRMLVRDATLAAIKKLREKGVDPVQVDYPATIRWEMVERCPVPSDARFKAIDGRTCERSGFNLEEIFLR